MANRGEGPSRQPTWLSSVLGDGSQPRGDIDLSPILGHACFYCDRVFPTLQSLGGHVYTSHRLYLEAQRREHESSFIRIRQVTVAPPPIEEDDEVTSALSVAAPENGRGTSAITIELLEPNHHFWEAYRRADQPPPFYNFLEIRRPAGSPTVMQVPPQQQPLVASDQAAAAHADTDSDQMVHAHPGQPEGQDDDAGSIDLNL